MNNIKFFLCFFGILFMLTGCEQPADFNEIPGVYTASYEGVDQELTLKPDGTYYYVVKSNGKRYSHHSTWSINRLYKDENCTMLRIDDYDDYIERKLRNKSLEDPYNGHTHDAKCVNTLPHSPKIFIDIEADSAVFYKKNETVK